MQKQMIVTVPEYIMNEGIMEGNDTLHQIYRGCSSFLKGETDVLILPDTFSYNIKDLGEDVSEVVLKVEGKVDEK